MVVYPSSIDQFSALPFCAYALADGVYAFQGGIESVIGLRYRAWIFCLVVARPPALPRFLALQLWFLQSLHLLPPQ
jgi:hypothetical protein